MWTLEFVITGPNLNSLWVRHSVASPLSKNHKKVILFKKLKKQNMVGVPRCSFFFYLFEPLKCPFSKSGAPFIPSYVTIILYSFFVSLDVSPLIQFNACVSNAFLLMITMFIKLVLWACYFDFIPNQAMGTYWSLHWLLGLPILILGTRRQTLSAFDIARRHMIDLTSDWKLRSAEKEGWNDLNVTHMVDGFISRSYQLDAFLKTTVLKILSRFINLLSTDKNRTPGDELSDFAFTNEFLRVSIQWKTRISNFK